MALFVVCCFINSLLFSGNWKIEVLCYHASQVLYSNSFDVNVYDSRDVIIVRDEELNTVAKDTEFKFEGKQLQRLIDQD